MKKVTPSMWKKVEQWTESMVEKNPSGDTLESGNCKSGGMWGFYKQLGSDATPLGNQKFIIYT